MSDSRLETPDARLHRLRRYARWLDASVRIPGTGVRLGFDSIIGLVPGLGDVVGAVLSLWVVVAAWRLGVRGAPLRRMLGNIALEGLVGVVPVAGDVFDVFFRANQRNVKLLERELGPAPRPGATEPD